MGRFQMGCRKKIDFETGFLRFGWQRKISKDVNLLKFGYGVNSFFRTLLGFLTIIARSQTGICQNLIFGNSCEIWVKRKKKLINRKARSLEIYLRFWIEEWESRDLASD